MIYIQVISSARKGSCMLLTQIFKMMSLSFFVGGVFRRLYLTELLCIFRLDLYKYHLDSVLSRVIILNNYNRLWLRGKRKLKTNLARTTTQKLRSLEIGKESICLNSRSRLERKMMRRLQSSGPSFTGLETKNGKKGNNALI